MIKMLRIDERLIHGQVAVTWCSTLGVDRIVIANNAAAADEVQQMALKMAAPEGVKVAIKDVEGAIAILNDERLARFTVLALVNCPADAVKVASSVNGIETVNLGNFGLFNDGKKRETIAYTVNVTSEERGDFKRLIELRPDAVYQPTSANPPQALSGIL